MKLYEASAKAMRFDRAIVDENTQIGFSPFIMTVY